jgi:fluoride ion exporter CrcB/FEX
LTEQNAAGHVALIILAVLVGGMLGAPARYVADRAVQARHDSVFPWGTFAVNMAGVGCSRTELSVRPAST